MTEILVKAVNDLSFLIALLGGIISGVLILIAIILVNPKDKQ